MSRSKQAMHADPFPSIAPSVLDEVSGGRMLQRTGPDPTIISMMTQLVESIKLVSAADEKKKSEKSAMMQQMMSMVMQKRG